MSEAGLIIRIWSNPMAVFDDLRDRMPIARLLGLATLLATMALMLGEWLVPQRRAAMSGWLIMLPGVQPDFAVALVLLESVITGVKLVLFVAVMHVPLVILLTGILMRRRPVSIRRPVSMMMREDYGATLSCTLAAFSATLLTAIVWLCGLLAIRWLRPGFLFTRIALVQLIVTLVLIFSILMVFAITSLFSPGWPMALAASLLSLTSLLALPLVTGLATTVCTSPVLVILLVFLLRDRVDDLLRSGRARRDYQRNLRIAMLNPADASAWCELGLFHWRRGERSKARQSFEKSLSIEPDEIDARYHLGIIAREESRFAEAITHFEQVIARNESYSQHEVWREIAQVYFAAGQFADTIAMLDRFQQFRPSDPEGHCLRGLALDRLERCEEAAAAMRACIEAVESAPEYSYRAGRRWLARAESYLRSGRA